MPRRVISSEIADNRFGLGLQFSETHEVRMACYDRTGTTLPPAVVEACVAADGVILRREFMTLYPPVSDGGVNIQVPSVNASIYMQTCDCIACRAGIPLSRNGLDVLIVRENTGVLCRPQPVRRIQRSSAHTGHTALSLRLITEKASRRIAKVAFEHARARRGHVTVIGKRHVMQVTDGLFVATVEERSPPISGCRVAGEMDIDAMAADLYLRRSGSMFCSPPTCSVTFCRTKRRRWRAAWGWPER